MTDIHLGSADNTYAATTAGDRIFGEDGNDNLTASGGGNEMYGGLGDDTLNGGAGNDILWGDDSTSVMGHNVINGKGGNDQIISYSWYDQISAGANDDIVYSYAMTTGQIVDGGTGTDTIGIYSLAQQGENVNLIFGSNFSPTVGAVQGATYTGFEILNFVGGGTGSTNVTGGGGNDTIIATLTNSSAFAAGSINGAGGDDHLEFSRKPMSGIEQVDGGAGTDVLTWTNGFDTFSALSIDAVAGKMKDAGTVFAKFNGIEALSIKTFSGSTGTTDISGAAGDDFVDVYGSSHTIKGNDGNDMLRIETGSANVDGGLGNDTLFAAFSNASSMTFHGGVGDDSVTGGQGQSALYGDDGNDRISAYNGRSSCYGGAGDDTLYNTSSYSMAGSGSAVVDGGGGHDYASLERSAATGNTFTIDFRSAAITLFDGTQILNCEGISFVASNGNDVMTASNSAVGYTENRLYGLTGDDILTASSNGGWLDGGSGYNLLIASAGVDYMYSGVADYEKSTKGVTVDLNITTAQGGGGYAKGDLLAATVLSVIGSAKDDVILGDQFTNTFNGGGGNDKLTGGIGFHDTLTGGAGKDTFIYGGAADSTGSSYDTVTDFDANADHFKVLNAVTGIDNTIATGALNTANFDADLGAAIGSKLKAHHAIVFTPDTGTLAGKTFLVVDQDGTAGYLSGSDLVIDITGAVHLSGLGASDFTT